MEAASFLPMIQMKHIPQHQAAVRVLGQEGSFHSQAARLLLPGEELKLIHCSSATEVLDLEEGQMAVLAVENRVLGPLPKHQRLLQNRSVDQLGEIWLPLDLVLAGASALPLKAIREVVSHPVALAQCSTWLGKHPWMHALSTTDTTAALDKLSDNPLVGAIASEKAVLAWKMVILATDISNARENATRFILVQNTNTGLT